MSYCTLGVGLMSNSMGGWVGGWVGQGRVPISSGVRARRLVPFQSYMPLEPLRVNSTRRRACYRLGGWVGG